MSIRCIYREARRGPPDAPDTRGDFIVAYGRHSPDETFPR